MNNKYWWYGYKIGGDVDLFTPEEADRVIAAKAQKESVWIDRIHKMVDTRVYSEIEESDRRYFGGKPEQLLGAGDERGASEVPVEGSGGGTACMWVKRRVRESTYQREYKGRVGYYPLRKNEGDATLYVVFSRPVFASGLPEGLEELEPFEVEIIEKRLGNRVGWWNAPKARPGV